MILSSMPEEKALLLNDVVVPGIEVSCSFDGRAQVDRSRWKDGGRDFTLNGFDPVEFSVNLKIVDEQAPGQVTDQSTSHGGKSREDLLAEVIALFRKTENGGQPVQYEILLPEARAWGIKRCYLLSMSSARGSKLVYDVSLKFVEFNPEIDRITKQQKKKQAAKSAPKPPSSGDAATTAERKQFDEHAEIWRRHDPSLRQDIY